MSALNEKVIASEFLSIYDISSYLKDDLEKDEEYLPTYGPRYVDLYNLEDKSRFQKRLNEEDLTKDMKNVFGISPDLFYVSRLLLSIKSLKYFRRNDSDELQNFEVESQLTKIKHEFIVFFIIDEVSMIDSRLNQEGSLSFQLIVGKNGYKSDDEKHPSNISKQENPIQLDSHMPVYLAFEKSKPCLSLKISIEDMRHYMFKSNFLQRGLSKFVIIFFNNSHYFLNLYKLFNFIHIF